MATLNAIVIKKIIILIFFVVLILPVSMPPSQALQQVAGPILFQLQPGQTKTMQWGLVSDDNKPVTLALNVDGTGSELISFPKTITIDPKQIVYIDITVTVPADHSNNVKLNPSIYATQFGETGGSTILNIRMQKVLTINIGTPPAEQPTIPQSTASKPQQPQTPQPPKQTQTPGTTEIVGGTTEPASTPAVVNKKGGGCLIATAAFGSELAPQIQQLRETRDRVLLSTQSGTTFMTGFNQFYYSFSPTVADWERENPVFKEIVKASITPLIATLSILNYVPIHSEAEMIVYGLGVIGLNVGMYFIAPAAIIVKLKHRK